MVKGPGFSTLSLNFSNILNEPFFDSEAIVPELDIEQKLILDFDTRVIKLSYIKKLGNMNVKSRNNRESGSGEILKRVGS